MGSCTSKGNEVHNNVIRNQPINFALSDAVSNAAAHLFSSFGNFVIEETYDLDFSNDNLP